VVDAEANVMVSAEITIAEVAAALGVIARTGRISRRQLDAFWGDSRVICCSATSSSRPAGQSSHALRPYALSTRCAALTPSISPVASSYRKRWRNRKRMVTLWLVRMSPAMIVW
jgi:hypothetical protein